MADAARPPKGINHMKISKPYRYVLVPLSFLLVGYMAIYFVFSPFILTGVSLLKSIVSEEKPDFDAISESIFNPTSDVTRETVPLSEVVIPDYETLYASLEIASVSIKDDLYFGDSKKTLLKGLGQYTGSFLPGFGKPILISGHNNLQFNALKNVKLGDTVTITTSYGAYSYKIREMKICNNADRSAYDLGQNKEELILYTCYPFDMMGLTPDRYFVYCDKVSGPDIADTEV